MKVELEGGIEIDFLGYPLAIESGQKCRDQRKQESKLGKMLATRVRRCSSRLICFGPLVVRRTNTMGNWEVDAVRLSEIASSAHAAHLGYYLRKISKASLSNHSASVLSEALKMERILLSHTVLSSRGD